MITKRNLVNKIMTLFGLLLILIWITIMAIIFCPPGILLDVNPQINDHPFPESFSGSFEVNDILSKAEKLFENQIEGPESSAVFNGTVFAGSGNGFIYKFLPQNKTLIPVLKLIDKSCQPWNQSLCGRPLAMRFDSKGILYVIEAFSGIYQLKDVMTTEPKVEHILSYSEPNFLNKSLKFLDDFVIEEGVGLDGGHVLYISEFSTEFDYASFIIGLSASRTGRLFRYDVNAKKLDLLVDNLAVANGIELSQDKQFLIFAQTASRTISKYYIRGEKQGQISTLLTTLPGEPDNIRKTKRNTYWVGLAAARTQQNRLWVDLLDDKPLLRKLYFRSLHLTGSVVQYFGDLFGSDFIRNFGFALKTGLNHFTIDHFVANTHGMAIEFNETGSIVRTIQSPNGAITLLSEVNEVEEQNTTVLYLGSVFNKFLGRLPLQ